MKVIEINPLTRNRGRMLNAYRLLTHYDLTIRDASWIVLDSNLSAVFYSDENFKSRYRIVSPEQESVPVKDYRPEPSYQNVSYEKLAEILSAFDVCSEPREFFDRVRQGWTK